jgi:hypothetical protein
VRGCPDTTHMTLLCVWCRGWVAWLSWKGVLLRSSAAGHSYYASSQRMNCNSADCNSGHTLWFMKHACEHWLASAVVALVYTAAAPAQRCQAVSRPGHLQCAANCHSQAWQCWATAIAKHSQLSPLTVTPDSAPGSQTPQPLPTSVKLHRLTSALCFCCLPG